MGGARLEQRWSKGGAWVERVWSKGGATVEHKRRASMEQEKRSGESTCFSPMWPGLKSHCEHNKKVKFVVGSCPLSQRFFS